ncbi:MAG: transketolase [Betaproteobacteria bacterium]|nr:transketolase [Betaproteobacteria bacterium]
MNTDSTAVSDTDLLYARAQAEFAHWEVVKDLVDESIDLMLNYRQSGHPGGSRSKVHALLSTMLSGAMRYDLLRPWRTYGDRFVLSAGHTVPLVYATLATLNEIARMRAAAGEARFVFPDGGRWALTWEDLLKLRHRGGLPGHAEMAGKTLFLKSNTGPSGHGMPPAAGEALALKLAGAEGVKVFVMEGEGGLTPGATHETKNSAWGLGLANLVFLVDWNDFGIDDNAISSVVHGTPSDWFAPYGWRVLGTEQGSDWASMTRVVLEGVLGANAARVPTMVWGKTRKGRGYGKYDNKSHGTPWPMNAPEFWAARKPFMEKYGVEFAGAGKAAPSDPALRSAQARANLEIAFSVLRKRSDVVETIGNRILAAADAVPERIAGVYLSGKTAAVFSDPAIYDFRNYPAAMYRKPGEQQPNRAALAAWGAWVNSYARKNYGRPMFIACSADLADSTNIAGFAKDFEGEKGWGWYQRDTNPRGCLLPQQITEFTNAGIMCGLASVNLAADPMVSFDGFWGACSTYASFSYLKYGAMRLFSQLAQDCELKVGKILWIAGHSGPETAEDSRTHFGIFETAVTQLFPEGQVIDLHPWEYNEVPVVLGAAFAQQAPIVALHLTRPSVEIPDRAKLGMASHFEAARGAYLLRDLKPGIPRQGTVFVQGTVTTANLVKILPKLDEAGLNVRIVAVISPQLFALQDPAYREKIASTGDRWDAMCITNRSLKTMREWIAHPIVAEYSLASDWDNRWRTGGSVDEVMDEAHLGPGHLFEGIRRFVAERELRLGKLRAAADAASG